MKPLMEGKRRLYDGELRQRLLELKETANREHDCCRKAWRGALENARNAGEALMEAEWRLGGRGKWKRWRQGNFDGSDRTVRVYRQVARYWDDPRIVAARRDGLEIGSIQGFLNVLRAKHPKPKPQPTLKQEAMADARESLRRQVAAMLLDLEDEELMVLVDNFERLWGRLYAELRNTVCAALECDYYEEDEELGGWPQLRPRTNSTPGLAVLT